MSVNIVMPEMGEGVAEGTIVRCLKQVGDAVRADEAVFEVETDKVTVEVTAEREGSLLQLNVREGQTVPVGTVLAVIGSATEGQAEVPGVSALQLEPVVNEVIEQQIVQVSETPSTKALSRDFDGVRVSPVVARMVQTHNLDVHELVGTGRDGRITKKDVLHHLEVQETTITNGQATVSVKPQANGLKKSDVSLEDVDEVMPLTGMRRAIAEHMVRSKHTSPHATTVFEFDFSAVASHRSAHKVEMERTGVKLTFTTYIALATVQALRKHRMVNAWWTDEGIVLKGDIHLGVAAAVPNGLVVPVIKNAENMSLVGLARSLADLSERARRNQLKPDEVRAGTFTISNHGVSGSLIGTPIINQPQVAIMGIGLIEKRLKVMGDAIVVRPCAYVSLSFDHRVLDGATADAFLSDIKHTIESFT